jgi:hypothetical protein
MARDLPGTPEKLVIDGNTFFFMGDADPAYGKPKWAITPLPHTGGTMHQMVRQDTGTTGNAIKVNGDELVILKELAERSDSYSIMWQNRAGDQYRCTGKITYDTVSAQNGRTDVTVYPDDDWTEIIA